MKYTFLLIFITIPLSINAKVRVDEPLPLIFSQEPKTVESSEQNNEPTELTELPKQQSTPEVATERIDQIVRPDLDLQDNLLEIYKYPVVKRGELLLQGARFALRQGPSSHLKAEKMFHEALRYELSPTQRKETLLELAQFYTEKNNKSKTILVYEKYLEMFPNDSERPQILFALANLYKEIKAYEVALDKYYEIINLSLAINEHQLPIYKRIATKAQIQIAETYFEKQDYESAHSLFKRLESLQLTQNEQDLVEFKTAYTNYHLENYDIAVKQLNALIEKSPNGRYSPQAMYLLAHTFKRTDKLTDSVKQVIKLINHPLPQNTSLHNEWILWKRKTANELANEFYENKDYVSALEIYQAMAQISDEAKWQWPIIYQIGRCYEHLNRLEKAKESYALISEAKQWDISSEEMTEALNSLRDTATWRMNNIEWVESTKSSVSKLLDPPAPELTPSKTDSRDT